MPKLTDLRSVPTFALLLFWLGWVFATSSRLLNADGGISAIESTASALMALTLPVFPILLGALVNKKSIAKSSMAAFGLLVLAMFLHEPVSSHFNFEASPNLAIVLWASYLVLYVFMSFRSGGLLTRPNSNMFTKAIWGVAVLLWIIAFPIVFKRTAEMTKV